MKARAWFTPPMLGIHVLAVVAVVACVMGGLWQFGAYENRQGTAAKDQRAEGIVPINDVWSPSAPFPAGLKSRQVVVEGQFASADDQFWVSNADTSGKFGLVAAFEVEGSQAALLVVRGAAPEVDGLPSVPKGRQKLIVSLQPSVPGSPPLDSDRVTTGITIPSLLNELPFKLWPGYGVVTESQDKPANLESLAIPDVEVPWTVGLVNLAYSLQWLVFGLFAIFMWSRLTREQLQGQADSLRR